MLLASNASTDLHPKNTLVNFENELPGEINAIGFKIALQSISVDSKFGNIPNAVLGTSNHFLLFTDNNHVNIGAAPSSLYNITDFTLSPATFARNVTKALSNTTTAGRLRVLIGSATRVVQFAMKNCVLLIHSEVNKMLNMFGAETFMYQGEKYTMLNSAAATRNFYSVSELPRTKIIPKIIKVQLQQMCQHLSNVKLVQDLAIIRVKPTDVYPFYNVCKRKEYFDLVTGRLTTLAIRLVDENNYPLQLGTGQPTFVKLQLKKFPMDSTVLRLSSLESADVFQDNKSSSFRIQLQQPLACQDWDVALSSIYLPSTPNIGHLLTANNFYIELPTSGGLQRLSLHGLRDFTTEGFVTHFTATVAAAFPNTPPPVKLIVEGREIHVECSVDTTVNISTMLAYLLSKNPSPDEPAFLPLKLDSSGKKYFGAIDFKKLHPQIILLYCNFVQPLVVGNTFGQVLQMIPYYNSGIDGGDVYKYEAQHLDFTAMSMNDRATLQFEMRNSGGDLIQFENDSAEILLTLVFREKMW